MECGVINLKEISKRGNCFGGDIKEAQEIWERGLREFEI